MDYATWAFRNLDDVALLAELHKWRHRQPKDGAYGMERAIEEEFERRMTAAPQDEEQATPPPNPGIPYRGDGLSTPSDTPKSPSKQTGDP